MSDVLLWTNAILSGLCLLLVTGCLHLLGRLVERVDSHESQMKQVRQMQEQLRRAGAGL